ncbi:MAG: Fur family transcriptional regulator [Roseibium sp.]|uniref:Fur family transcriptional regulator n=1 Tax=Roseibium sp. TaxID=1936156 RepID=UPI003D9C2CB4
MSAHAHPELTKNQSLVFGSLSEAGGPLTAYAILDLLREDGFRAPLQVYRALDKLVEYGMVHRLESLNAFVACAHTGCSAHGAAAFAICEQCGDVIEFTPDEALKVLGEWTKAQQFSLSRMTIELRGTCSTCALKAI